MCAILNDRLSEEKVRLECMRPRQIIEARNHFPVIYIAAGPIEWHSFHMPYGNDGMRGHLIMVEIAKRCGGVVMPPIYLGTDSERTLEEKKKLDLPLDQTVFGMSFPTLPLTSMYCKPDLMRQIIELYLHWAKVNEFKYAFVMPSHGGAGHAPTCQKAVENCKDNKFYAEVIMPANFVDKGKIFISGHGRIEETELIMALRPELVDLSELPKGKLKVSEYGMLGSAYVPEEKNPVNARREQGIERIEMIVKNVALYVNGKVNRTISD